MRLVTLLLLTGSSLTYKFDDCEPKPQALSQVRRVGPKSYAYNLDFYYQKALPSNIIHTFTDVFLQINLTNANQYQFYQDSENRYFGLLQRAALLRSHQLNPFLDTVVGVSTAEAYEVSISIWMVNYVRFGIYVGAILLFLLANKLVRNVIFYYISGCSFGVIASILLVAFNHRGAYHSKYLPLGRFIEGQENHVTEDESYAHEIFGDILDREDYEDDYGRPLRYGIEEDEQEELIDENANEQEYDELLIRRLDSNSGRRYQQTVFVPRRLSTRILSPFENRLKQTVGADNEHRRRDIEPHQNGYHSDHRYREPRSEQINRSRRVQNSRIREQQNERLSQPLPPWIEASSSSRSSSSTSMTPSEYMRDPSRTPPRRPIDTRSQTESEEAEE